MKYRTLREYRDGYPSLVVLTMKDEFPQLTRAIEAVVPATSGGGLPPLPIVRGPVESAWAAGRLGEHLLVYTMAGAPVDLDLTGDGTAYDVRWVDAATGGFARSQGRVAGGGGVTLVPPEGGAGRPWAAWLVKRTGR